MTEIELTNKLNQQADLFAMAFLMPKDEFVEVSKKVNGDIAELACHLEVSKFKAERRKRHLESTGELT